MDETEQFLVLDRNQWEKAQLRKFPAAPATETLEELGKRLSNEHCDSRHAGEGVRWEMDLAGIYCPDCLEEGYTSIFPHLRVSYE